MMLPLIEIVALSCIVWYIFIVLVCTIGCVQLFRHYSRPPPSSVSGHLPQDESPHITIIRPCKGREPYLYECLASSFEQEYPRAKLTIYLCIATKNDTARKTIEKVLQAYPQYDAKMMIEEDDVEAKILGPNPKIRNMSRAYREAKGDIVWIADCNVWLSRGACGRMVDKLEGRSLTRQEKPYKFVHHIPVAIDVSHDSENGLKLHHETYEDVPLLNTSNERSVSTAGYFGGQLDEAFLSSAHAKMYVAINTVAVAPCICGKSSMFRRSHLNALTNEDNSVDTQIGSGIDYFSSNICEDHLIGDMLWKAEIPSTMPPNAQYWRNHGLVYGDIALQPIANMSISNYVARRARWLRVRKYTVPLATLVEPGTESFLCSVYGAWGFTTSRYTKHVLGSTWPYFLLFWLVSILVWISIDWQMYGLLQSNATVSDDDMTASLFARRTGIPRRPFTTWLKAWLSREALALPVWTYAIWGGATVVWRDKKLWVGMDMKVHDYADQVTGNQPASNSSEPVRSRASSKVRQE